MGRLQGPGIDPSNDLAAFLTDPGGLTQLVCRTGDTIDVFGDGSDLRVLANFATDTGPREGGGALEQVFEFLFTDGSAGAFVGAPPVP